MKVINISTDRKIFEHGSAVGERMKEYGTLFDGLHVVVFCLKKDGYKKRQLSEHVWAYPTESRSKIGYIFDAISIARNMLKRVKDRTEWAVSTQDPFETGIVGLILKRIFKAQLNVQVHTDVYSPFFRKESFHNRMRFMCAIHVLKAADSVRVVSRRIQESLIERGISDKKISILPIFVDKGQYDEFQDVTRKEKTVLVISRLTSEKNIFFLIDVISDVVDADPEVRVVIVGDGVLRQELEQYAQEKSLATHIRFVGWSNDVSKWYREAGLLLHTSLFEGYGMVFVEAALQHVPIVSSDVGIMNDVFVHEKSALICPVGDKRCFAQQIKRVLEDKSLAQKMSDSAYQKVLKHLPESKGEYLQAYKEAI